MLDVVSDVPEAELAKQTAGAMDKMDDIFKSNYLRLSPAPRADAQGTATRSSRP